MRIRLHKGSFFQLFMPLVIAVFATQGTSFVTAVIGPNIRWVFVFALISYLLVAKKYLVYINQRFFVVLSFYLLWCLSTILWSTSPELSLLKSILFVIMMIALISAGSLWAVKYGFSKSLDWLFIFVLVTYAAIFLGSLISGESSIDLDFNVNAYQGLTFNPNMLGFMIMMSLSYLFFKIYLIWPNQKKRLLYSLLFIVMVIILLKTMSRSAFVGFLCVTFMCCLSLNASKKILIISAGFLIFSIALLLIPNSMYIHYLKEHFYKQNPVEMITGEKGLFLSRQAVWQVSEQDAIKGGAFGAGFGVDLENTHYHFSTKTHAREKGNSQMAIMEETGIVGLILYAITMITFFLKVVPFYFSLKGENKIAIGILLGIVIGLLIESIVEAWWDSAAAPEFIIFWMTVGVIQGLLYLNKRKSRQLNHVHSQ